MYLNLLHLIWLLSQRLMLNTIRIFDNLQEGQMRHDDHRFEWTRKEFEIWAKNTAKKYSYQVEFSPIGPVHEIYGSPTQMGVFKK